MSDKLKPVTVLLPPETLELIEDEAKQTGIPKGINLRNAVIKHYAERKLLK